MSHKQQECERLSQAKLLAWLNREVLATEMLMVYLSDYQGQHNRGIYCALIPSARIEESLAKPKGDVMHGDGLPGACEYSGENGPELRIVIFLSVLNVHLNRSPCGGVVRDVKYEPGQFLNALKPESTEKNERNTLTLEPDGPIPGPVVVRQITGALARRIVCVAKPGERLKSGQRFGMIKLGSRTELRAAEHADWRVLVNVGENVKAGISVLARLETA